MKPCALPPSPARANRLAAWLSLPCLLFTAEVALETRQHPLQAPVHSLGPGAGRAGVPVGYRLCTKGPGLHTVHLEHRFDTPATPDGVPRAWPVRTEIASL